MDSLKRLIARLTCPRGISNEDAFDTVKQYWDDVTSGYWQDTDEELAEELGVTPTALAELLEVHRHTFNYANIGGNSSVRGYDHGEDWLVVMFSDGSRYLYTLKSTDRQTLDYMRRLAMTGKGLNSYITRIVGPNYAGRNYKGTITIKPGMEQFNPEGYRRLLLLQAFRNTMTIKAVTPHQVTLEKYKEQIATAGTDGLGPVARSIMTVGLESMGYSTQVSTESIDDQLVNATQALEGVVDQALISVGKPQASNEGIWGAVRYLFGGNYEDLPKINAAYDEAVDAVKATYGNPEWVKKRRLNTDKPIKLASHYFSEIARDPAKALERVKKENHKAVEDVIQYVKEEVEYLSKFTKALSSGDETKIKALLDMFEVRKVRSLDVAEELGFDHGDEVKGMSAEQIHKAAEVFIDGINYRRSTDAFYTQGMYKLMYTEAGNIRYGDGGAVTEKLNGPAKELALKIGQSADNVERSFYNSFGPAWENVDRVVKTTLAIMEASAK